MTPQELKQKLDLGVTVFLMGREIKEIARMVQNNEDIGAGAAVLLKKTSGLLVATSQRIIFVSKILFDVKIEEFYYKQISTVQFKSGIAFAELELFSTGSLFQFHQINIRDGKKLSSYIKDQIVKVHSPAPTVNQTVINEIDPIDKLEKLASLKDRGIISEEEFNAKKKEILGII